MNPLTSLLPSWIIAFLFLSASIVLSIYFLRTPVLFKNITITFGNFVNKETGYHMIHDNWMEKISSV
jgi:hypothetical protein